jgi:carbon monoxide dehydrogenase subunit G
MQIKFEGTAEIAAPSKALFEFLTDTSRVAGCIPDTEGFTKIDDKNFSVNVRVGIGFVRGTFNMKGRIDEAGSGRASYSLEGSGVGSKVGVSLSFELGGSGDSSSMHWNAVFTLTGLVSGVPEAVMKKKSKEQIDLILDNIKGSVEKV